MRGLQGVYSTAVGYCGGNVENPTYQQVCSGRSGHNEVVMVAYDESKVSYADLLRMVWESHDPTQGMGQGNDRGTQYRSGIYYYDEDQKKLALASKEAYQVRPPPLHIHCTHHLPTPRDTGGVECSSAVADLGSPRCHPFTGCRPT